MEQNLTIRLDDKDNTVVARKELKAGTHIPEENILLLDDCPMGYKIAAKDIKKGEEILKYDTIIGFAKRDIKKGEMVHNHNIEFRDLDLDYAYSKKYVPTEYIPEAERPTFMGYKRANGEVGTRNYIGVFTMSNCAATVARKVANYFTPERLAKYENVDGVVPFILQGGCGMESYGEGIDQFRRTIAGYVNHKNIGGSVMVALGCERNKIDDFISIEKIELSDTKKRLVMQEIGGTRKTIEAAIAEIEKMLPIVNECKREPASVEHLTLALECGGSDSFSGLSANPALGKAVDKLVKCGGTAILAELTEIYGVEHTLTARAVTPEVGKKLVDRITWWKEYSKGASTQVNGVVAPGNNAGGLTNVLEKSLGGAKKSGSTGLMEVYRYGEKVDKKGFVFMDTPGYDPVATTGQVAGGANIVTFTTGRGSCFGGYPSPAIKLASNTKMYNVMEEDMDINCGKIIDGECTLEEMGDYIFDMIIRVASGEETKSEALGVGADEYQPWYMGAIS